MQATLNGSWAWITTDSICNPFGSFRHEGAFPDSLFADPAKQIQEVTRASKGQSGETDPDDSTHLYINMMDRSDLDNVKTTRFWKESGYDDAPDYGCCFDVDSDATKTTSRRSDVHRTRTKQRTTPELRNGEVDVKRLAGVRSTTRPSVGRQNAASAKVKRPKRSAVEMKVGSWLEDMSAACHGHQGGPPARHSEQSDSRSRSSSLASSTDSGRGQPSGASENEMDNRRPHSGHWDISKDSDATVFMHQPMVIQGIKRYKISNSKRHHIVRKIKHFGRLLSNTGHTKISTLAVL